MARSGRRAAANVEAAVTEPLESALLAKTRLCRFYARGRCVRGEACSFAHGAEQLREQPDLIRTRLCFDYLRSGCCRAGDRCRYAHGERELRSAELHAGGGAIREEAQAQVGPVGAPPRGPHRRGRVAPGSKHAELARRLAAMQEEAARLTKTLASLCAAQHAAAAAAAPRGSGGGGLAGGAFAPSPPLLLGEGLLRGPVKFGEACGDKEEHECTNIGFSRQSTKEGTAIDSDFEDSDDSGDESWGAGWGPVAEEEVPEVRVAHEGEGEAGTVAAPAGSGDEEDDEGASEIQDFTLCVRNTFLCARPVLGGPAAHRRARSAPVGGQPR